MAIRTARIAHKRVAYDPVVPSGGGGGGGGGSTDPLILYTDIVMGPKIGGENNNGCYLTIFGNNFGATRGSSTVTINGVEVAAYKAWSDMQITVQPGSAVSTGNIRVTVGGVSSPNDSAFTFTVVTGDIYFVALNGNDSTGVANDISHPFRDISNTINRADFGAGDHLVIRGGTWSDVNSQYGSFFSIANKGGTSAGHIGLMGYPGETVQFNYTTQTRGFHSFGSPGYFTLSNIHINGNQHPLGIGIDPGAQSTRIVNNEVTGFFENSGGAAAVDGSGRNHRVFGNHLHNNGGSKLYHAVYFDSRGTNDGVEIAYNYIHHQGGGRAIQIYGDTGTPITNINIHHNWIHNIALNGILLARDCTTGHQVHHNLVYDTADPAMRGATGDEGTSGSTFRMDDRGGVNQLSANVFNNTFYHGDIDGDVDSSGVSWDSSAAVVFQNNVIVPTTRYSTGTPPTSHTISGNVWFGAGSAPSYDASPINSDPVLDANYVPTATAALGKGCGLLKLPIRAGM